MTARWTTWSSILATGAVVFVFPRTTRTPATYTILNFPVDDVDAAVDKIDGSRRDDGAVRPGDLARTPRASRRAEGPAIAWFKDPSGNILSVLTGM